MTAEHFLLIHEKKRVGDIENFCKELAKDNFAHKLSQFTFRHF